jgi:hypothetical protein
MPGMMIEYGKNPIKMFDPMSARKIRSQVDGIISAPLCVNSVVRHLCERRQLTADG